MTRKGPPTLKEIVGRVAFLDVPVSKGQRLIGGMASAKQTLVATGDAFVSASTNTSSAVTFLIILGGSTGLGFITPEVGAITGLVGTLGWLTGYLFNAVGVVVEQATNLRGSLINL